MSEEDRFVYDVLEYHSYSSRKELHGIGERIALFGGDYEVVDVSPPIHADHEATLVVKLYSGASPEDLGRAWPDGWRTLDSS